jgi:hypothetical protein
VADGREVEHLRARRERGRAGERERDVAHDWTLLSGTSSQRLEGHFEPEA